MAPLGQDEEETYETIYQTEQLRSMRKEINGALGKIKLLEADRDDLAKNLKADGMFCVRKGCTDEEVRTKVACFVEAWAPEDIEDLDRDTLIAECVVAIVKCRVAYQS